jgi:hypothetical protein
MYESPFVLNSYMASALRTARVEQNGERFMKKSTITRLNQFPMTDLLQKVFVSNRSRAFDEFIKFKSNDPDVTTLNIFAEESDGKSAIRYVFVWNGRHGRQQKVYARFDPAGSEALFAWEDVHGAPIRNRTYGHFPFDDEAFDWVFCESVIEHVGGAKRQYLLLEELMRVARKGIFVTTSNRWHPIEFYTALPLLHWLPSSWWKRILRFLGKEVWASESMLNLLDAKALQKFVNMLPQAPECSIGHIRFLGLKAYFFLQIRKEAIPDKARSCAAVQH